MFGSCDLLWQHSPLTSSQTPATARPWTQTMPSQAVPAQTSHDLSGNASHSGQRGSSIRKTREHHPSLRYLSRVWAFAQPSLEIGAMNIDPDAGCCWGLKKCFREFLHNLLYKYLISPRNALLIHTQLCQTFVDEHISENGNKVENYCVQRIVLEWLKV